MPALFWDLNQHEYEHYDLCLSAPLLLGPHHSTMLPVCDAAASGLTKRINLQSLALSLDFARAPVPGWAIVQQLPRRFC